MGVTKEEARKALSEGRVIADFTFSFKQFEDGSIWLFCPNGTCDCDFNTFDEMWSRYGRCLEEEGVVIN